MPRILRRSLDLKHEHRLPHRARRDEQVLRTALRISLLVICATGIVLIGVFYWPWPYTALAVILILLIAIIAPLERRSRENGL
jgi:O-antigen/teichoic acid export membrane protein